MKLISFIEPHYLDPKIIVEVVLTEDEVLDVYWDYWKDKMEKAEKPSHLITESNCIEDFITVHWAV
ncbi:hypothetical protein, partial [Actinomyces sp. 186855]|uniref:hypothetical protein n=1 Tax=Actinomyces sp. 186855 TaxID=2761164 RepID=UPI0020172224